MAAAWDLLISRSDLSLTELSETAVATPGPGEVLLQIDRVGMTANNVTYALEGDTLRYWSFFPADNGWGRLPVWGFAHVADSQVDGLEVGAGVYGYFPTSSHLVVAPDRVGASGFLDASEHRADLPRVYNRYALTTGDGSFKPGEEDLQIVFRPLFFTSFMLDDYLADNGFFDAEQIVVSSASSKTAYGTAFCIGLREAHPRLVALTSERNVGFTESLGCYDEVLSYDGLETMDPGTGTLYLDVAGDQKLRTRIHEHFADRLRHDAMVGASHGESIAAPGPAVSDPQPQFFFAPAQIQKRRGEWEPGELERRYASVWERFVPVVRGWIDVRELSGREGLRSAWLEVLSGTPDPRTALVVQL